MTANPASETHKNQVIVFLQKAVKNQQWLIEHPPYGRGQETYFAKNETQAYFAKLGAQNESYQVMAQLRSSPNAISVGAMKDGTTILVLDQIKGRNKKITIINRYFFQIET